MITPTKPRAEAREVAPQETSPTVFAMLSGVGVFFVPIVATAIVEGLF